MFSRLAIVSTVMLLATFTAATDPHNPPPSDSCTTGKTYCCNSVADGSDPAVVTLAHSLNVVGTIAGTVGLTCNAITVIGGTSTCGSQTVCCTGNDYGHGLLVVGCSPITV